jgi:hypothetical protein
MKPMVHFPGASPSIAKLPSDAISVPLDRNEPDGMKRIDAIPGVRGPMIFPVSRPPAGRETFRSPMSALTPSIR